jgi:hypothetical protein
MSASLNDLAESLESLGHGDQGLARIKEALSTLDLGARVAWLAEHLLTPPLTHEVAQGRAGEPVEPFNVLQGDIIRTSAAYRFGVRVDPAATYMVATSSCDLVPGRRAAAMLLPVEPKRRSDFGSDSQFTGNLNQLTNYGPKKYFYIPVLPDDDEDVLFNAAWLDPIATCTNEAVNLAERRASLSLVGWRMFGTLVRELLVREAEQEPRMRTP